MFGVERKISTKAEVLIKISLEYNINSDQRRVVKKITKQNIKMGGNEFDVAVYFMIGILNALNVSAHTKVFVIEKVNLLNNLTNKCMLSQELDYQNSISIIEEKHYKKGTIEKDLYLAAYQEVANDQLDDGTWAKAFSESLGDENQVESAYIKLRTSELMNEFKEQKKNESKENINKENMELDRKIKTRKRGNRRKIYFVVIMIVMVWSWFVYFD